MADDTGPTPEAIAEAQATLNAAALIKAKDDGPRKTMIELVTDDGFNSIYDKMVAAQAVNPANVQLSYCITMMSQLKQSFAA